jgi:hypothetical protein
MKMAQILQIERPAKAYSCDACGSRDPHCKACAKAREAAAKHMARNEAQRKLMRERRALANAPVENIEDFDSPKEYEEMLYGDILGHHARPPRGTPPEMKIRGFLYRAKESKNAANLDWIKGVKPTKEMLAAAEEAAVAWGKVYAHLREG